MSEISELQPAVQLRTTGVLISPRLVRTPVTLPFERLIPVTSVYGWISAPPLSAPRASPQTTASWRITPPGGW